MRPGAGPRLPIWATVTATYRTAFGRYRTHLAGTLFLPVAISLLILASETGVRAATDRWQPWQIWTVTVVPRLLELIPYTLFAVAWHRLILLDEARAKPVWSWSRRHWIFLAYALAFTTLLILANRGFGTASKQIFLWTSDGEATRLDWADLKVALVVGTPISTLLIVGLWLRASLIYPAVAIARPISPIASWRTTAGQGLRLLTGYVLAAVPIVLLDYVTQTFVFVALFRAMTGGSGVDIATASNQVANIVNVMMLLIEYVLVVISVTFLSLCYRWFLGAVHNGAGRPQ